VMSALSSVCIVAEVTMGFNGHFPLLAVIHRRHDSV
jgi:hypothetical protein